MNFELDSTQREIVDLVNAVLEREAGADRARAVLAETGYDDQLEATLGDLGLLDLAVDEEAGPLEATLVVERIAAHLGCIGAGARLLVGPALGLELKGPIALATDQSDQVLRFADASPTVLLLTDDDACIATVSCTRPALPVGDYGMARADLAIQERLGADARATLVLWWRVALGAEVTGLAEAALALTVDHLMARSQFGRPLASLQTIQHRLSELYVSIESTKWLTRHAAYLGTNESSAMAAASASRTARQAIWELHQLQGAIGFTKEYDLHLMTVRLHALRLELSGADGSHSRSVADSCWNLSSRDRTASWSASHLHSPTG